MTSDWAHFEYKCTDLYDPGGELTIAWDDPAIGIRWPLEHPVLSRKDRDGLALADAVELLAAARAAEPTRSARSAERPPGHETCSGG